MEAAVAVRSRQVDPSDLTVMSCVTSFTITKVFKKNDILRLSRPEMTFNHITQISRLSIDCRDNQNTLLLSLELSIRG